MQDIIEKLSGAVDKFATYIKQLPPSALQLSNTPRWGAREVLIHLVFWHEYYVMLIHSLMIGDRPKLIQGTLKQQNVLAVEQNKHESIAVLLMRLHIAEKQLEVLYRNPRVKEIQLALRVGGKERTSMDMLAGVEAHIRNHQKQLIKQLD